MLLNENVQQAIAELFHELTQGPAPDAAWVLNPGDGGFIASLEAVSSEEASGRPGGRSSIAAHVDHVRYGLHLMNRWAAGEEDPFATANYSASWRRQRVTDEEWRNLREALAREAHLWERALQAPRHADRPALTGMIASVVHLAYHLGAIRQISAATVGPPAKD
jgi:hypothetical protein